jgi:hypothetical protein
MSLSHNADRRSAKSLRIPRASLAIVLLAPLCFGSAPQPPTPDRTPVQAELVKAIEAGRARVGDTVFARVSVAWKNSNCKLREGAILKGRVVVEVARSKSAKASELAILFESGECGGRDLKPLPLTVAALLAPDPRSSLYHDQQSQPLNEAVGLGLGQEGSGSPMRSMTTAAATVLAEPPRSRPPQVVMPGQVIGIAGVKLNVGSGPDGGSMLTSEKHNMRLESGSRFVLVPNLNTSAPDQPKPADPSGSPAPSASATADVTSVEDESETDICVPPACSEAPASNIAAETGTSSAAAFSMPVKQLGFAAAADREMYGLDHDVAITYLGPGRLLFSFNPHLLVSRTGSETALPKLHIVRAALIDLQTMKATRTADWRVHDAEQYLWPMGHDRVLVHVGRDLRLYGPDLKMEQKLALSGPLAFVRVSPSGAYLAVGAIRERHSETIHRQLAEAEDREPEEDVELKVLDANFHTLATITRSSRELPPMLSENGEIRLSTIGKNRWRVAEYSWTGQRRVVKQLESTCRPEVTTLPPDLLFLTGCDRLGDGKWYRMLRPDGKLVLKGSSPSTEQGHTASGSAGSAVFAVGITESAKPIGVSAAFHSSDLKDLHIGVYRAENGKKVSGVSIPDPLPTVQTFALSPDGRQLAIVENNRIVVYALPAIALN